MSEKAIDSFTKKEQKAIERAVLADKRDKMLRIMYIIPKICSNIRRTETAYIMNMTAIMIDRPKRILTALFPLRTHIQTECFPKLRAQEATKRKTISLNMTDSAT